MICQAITNVREKYTDLAIYEDQGLGIYQVIGSMNIVVTVTGRSIDIDIQQVIKWLTGLGGGSSG